MWTTTENNDRVAQYRMFQISCIAFIVLMLCHTVPGIFTNLYEAVEARRTEKSYWGYLMVAGMYAIFTVPIYYVAKLYKGLGRHIEVVRYGNPPANPKDGCLGVSEGEILDGREEL
jgi:hypothetical protein